MLQEKINPLFYMFESIKEVSKAKFIQARRQRPFMANRTTTEFLNSEIKLEQERLRREEIKDIHASELIHLRRRLPMKIIEKTYDIIPGDVKGLATEVINNLRGKKAITLEEEAAYSLFKQNLKVSRLGNGANYRVFLAEVINDTEKHIGERINGSKARLVKKDKDIEQDDSLIGKRMVLKIGNTFSFTRSLGDPGDITTYRHLGENLNVVKSKIGGYRKGTEQDLSHLLPTPQLISWAELGEKYGGRTIILQPYLDLLSKGEIKALKNEKKRLRGELKSIFHIVSLLEQKDKIRFDLGKNNLMLARFSDENQSGVHFVLVDTEMINLKQITSRFSPMNILTSLVQNLNFLSWVARLSL